MGTLAPEWSPPERFLLPIHTAAAPLPTRGGARLVVTLVDWDRFFPDVDLARAVVKLANLPPVALSDRDARGRAEAAAAAAAYGGDGTTDASSAPTRGGGDAGELLERTTGVETDASTQATTTTKAPSPPRDGVAREVRRLVVPLLDVETNEPVRAVGCNAPLALELRLGVRAAAEARRHRADAVFAYEVRSRRRGTSGVAPSTTTTQKVIVMYRTSASRHARSSGRPHLAGAEFEPRFVHVDDTPEWPLRAQSLDLVVPLPKESGWVCEPWCACGRSPAPRCVADRDGEGDRYGGGWGDGGGGRGGATCHIV